MHLLSGFFSNVQETTDDISATNEGGTGSIAEEGETVTVPTGSGDIEGEYLGPVTLSSAAVGISVGTGFNLASLSVTLNDVQGHVIYDQSSNTAYIISDQDLADDRLGATVTGSVLGIPLVSVDLPLSEVIDGLGLAPAGDFVQDVLDTAVFTLSEGPGDLELGVTCFTRGTLIRTQRGDVPVEALQVGDLVVTRDNGLQELRWIGSVKLGRRRLDDNPNLRPVRIKAGALGTSVPSSDLVVSPQHRVLVRSKVAQRMFGTDEVLAAAKQLLHADGIDIATDMEEVEYFHMLFDRHEVVVSNGAETESLYTGSEALKSVGKAARAEIFALFPELKEADYAPAGARELLSGRQARKLAMRHVQNNKPFVH
ncbi:Hint domain-containing protein (plasmid) [Paracoccus seriniphilus]|nr:Hint domain-containing protein [Paracoccus seriniphilus]